MREQDDRAATEHATPRRTAPSRTTGGPRSGVTGSAAHLLHLQRTLGNAVVARMVEEARSEEPGAPVQRSTVEQVLSSRGSPMDAPVREEMETRLEADFSDVELHTGATAQRAVAEVGARALTSGNHVVLGEDAGDPHILAHELGHVIQQRNGPVDGTDNGDGLKISDPSDRFERAAEENARRVMSVPLEDMDYG